MAKTGSWGHGTAGVGGMSPVTATRAWTLRQSTCMATSGLRLLTSYCAELEGVEGI